MNNTFTLKTSAMSKEFVVDFTNYNVVQLEINASEVIYCQLLNKEIELETISAKSGRYELDLAQYQGDVLKSLRVLVYIVNSHLSVDVDLTISCAYHPYYLSGDFHCHSLSSGDGVHSLKQLVQFAQEQNLDFITLTDHNAISGNLITTDFLVIHGVELTNQFGHCNLIGKKAPLKDFKITNYQEQLKKIHEATTNEATLIVNHPFSPKSRSWLVSYDDVRPNAVEIWNGPWGIHNRVAFEWWIGQLNLGNYLPAIGGSDFHNFVEGKSLNVPTNVLPVRFKSCSGIVESMLKGSVIIKDTEIVLNHYRKDDVLYVEFKNVKLKQYVYFYQKDNIKYHELSHDHIFEFNVLTINTYLIITICDDVSRNRQFKLITNPLVMKGEL